MEVYLETGADPSPDVLRECIRKRHPGRRLQPGSLRLVL